MWRLQESERKGEKVIFEYVTFGNNKQGLIDSINRLDPTQRFVVSARKWKSKRSDLQNRAYWAFLREFGNHLGYDDEELHETLKAKFLSDTVDMFGEQIRRAKSTTKLKTNEFAEYFDHCMRLAAEQGFYFDMRGYE